MRVRFTRAARADLKSIADWIGQYRPEASRRTLEGLRRRFSMLSDAPDLGRERTDIAPGLRGHAVGRYLVLYRREDDALLIVRIIDGRRDLAALFQN